MLVSFYVWLAGLLRGQMFQTWEGNDDWEELVNPEKYSLTNTQNIYITSDHFQPGEKIGGWWIRADPETYKTKKMVEEKASDKYTKMLHDMPELGTDDTVVILLHGNAKNRGASHRLAAYKLFQSQGYHTLTLDYRGYGDSVLKGEIGEDTLIQDAKAAMEFVRREVGDKAKLIIYGHSMGTGITSRAVAEVTRDKTARVDGIILDSPFHSISGMLDRMGYFGKALGYVIDFERVLKEARVEFNSPKWLATLEIPITIFHAECDPVCPIEFSELIIEDVKKMGKENIKMIRWTEDGLGHIGIAHTKTFPKHVKDYVQMIHQINK